MWNGRSRDQDCQEDRAVRLPRMQFTIRQMIIGVAILSALVAWGIELARRSRLRFDFYDYRVADNEPFINSTELLGLEGNRVDLGGGRYLEVEATTWTYSDDPAVCWLPGDLEPLIEGLEDELAGMRASGTAGVVDLQAAPDGRTLLYVRMRRQPRHCGTRLGPPPIRIPLFRRAVYLNRRLLIGIGKLKQGTWRSSDRDDELRASVASSHL